MFEFRAMKVFTRSIRDYNRNDKYITIYLAFVQTFKVILSISEAFQLNIQKKRSKGIIYNLNTLKITNVLYINASR